ncbi:hypothetical protein NEPAR04_1044 [Nematocida parisii]|nr:hypothetical protein NEPAR03_1052 [Nematocida parisii]KAI5128917.1 hypothetical protein NEPAR08_1404 [Nematocida parisii]KAI5141554.1 hypothetical protein NEPAR04_1044 [Nematocida parisii]
MIVENKKLLIIAAIGGALIGSFIFALKQINNNKHSENINTTQTVSNNSFTENPHDSTIAIPEQSIPSTKPSEYFNLVTIIKRLLFYPDESNDMLAIQAFYWSIQNRVIEIYENTITHIRIHIDILNKKNKNLSIEGNIEHAAILENSQEKNECKEENRIKPQNQTTITEIMNGIEECLDDNKIETPKTEEQTNLDNIKIETPKTEEKSKDSRD